MNLSTLPIQDSIQSSPFNASCQKPASDIAEFLLLEQCAKRCQTLAHQLAGTDIQHPLMGQLGDCLTACDSYLAAKVRESDQEDQFAALCMAALIDTAAACTKFGTEAAHHCQQVCRVCQQFIGSHRTLLLAS